MFEYFCKKKFEAFFGNFEHVQYWLTLRRRRVNNDKVVIKLSQEGSTNWLLVTLTGSEQPWRTSDHLIFNYAIYMDEYKLPTYNNIRPRKL